jgi:nucleotide-binding universal stress UspA family protein
MLIKKILIGIDNSAFSEYAAKYGFDMARTFNAKVGLAHIVEPNFMPPSAGMDPLSGSLPDAIGDAEIMNVQNEMSENLLEKTEKKFGKGLQVTHFNEFGDTADGIIDCSKDFKADLIILGTHSRSGIDRLLMGSVAEHVVRHSEIPVLVVPMKESES